MEKIFSKYLTRQKIELQDEMMKALSDGVFIIIPAYLEMLSIEETLCSIINSQKACCFKVNIIVVVNCGIEDCFDIQNDTQLLYQFVCSYANDNSNEQLCIIPLLNTSFSPKEKGAGSARKFGMDQVVSFTYFKGLDDSVIVSLDADSVVAQNYVEEIYKFFENKKNKGCSIYFEHPVMGDRYSSRVYEGIVLYELHLRYYMQALKAAGFPFAFQTVGSSMAFRTSAYVKAGGMTKKQAGEDFYMIHKLVLQGGFENLNSTTVYPSPRPSGRVIFGTGATIAEFLKSDCDEYYSYNIQSFIDLKEFFDKVGVLHVVSFEEYEKIIIKMSGRLRSFLIEGDFWGDLIHIRKNSSSNQIFKKRFFELFNAFKIIKYLNFVHSYYLEKTEVTEAAVKLLEMNKKVDCDSFFSVNELLTVYRSIDKQGEALKFQI